MQATATRALAAYGGEWEDRGGNYPRPFGGSGLADSVLREPRRCSVLETTHLLSDWVCHCMAKISSAVKRALLNIPLRHPSPMRIPRSGEAGAAVNCYTTRVIRGADESLLADSADGNTINCLQWDGDRYSIEKKIDFDDLLGGRFEFTHYHGLNTTIYSGWMDLALGYFFKIPYILAALHAAYHRVAQGFYNRKKFVTKQRIDLLKVVLNAQLGGRDWVSSLAVMSLIHTDRWYLHPDHEREHRRIDFYLKKLAETNDLVRSGGNYQISGQGVAAIEIYEEQERKHGESIYGQRRMFWLTIVIALLTLVQSGLVRLPPILDLTNP